jgi:hypothetical protein
MPPAAYSVGNPDLVGNPLVGNSDLVGNPQGCSLASRCSVPATNQRWIAWQRLVGIPLPFQLLGVSSARRVLAISIKNGSTA